jgi:glycosyltransferase involved in cell wall biosynthesis
MVKYLVTEVMPKIWECRPTVCLTVVGKDPPADIKALGENPLIKITGTVDDIRPYLWRATVAVVPLIYGAGIQNKILEAMATGTPVVTTTKALASLRVNSGVEILVGDSPEEFSQKVLDLMDSSSTQRSVGEKGASYVQKNHHWKTIVARLADIYRGSIDRIHKKAA